MTVRVSDVTFEALAGETIMAAAIRAGYRWPSLCGGSAICTACHVVIEQGSDTLAPPDATEAPMLVRLAGRARYRGRTVRLACQTRVHGDLILEKKGVRRSDDPPKGL